MWRWYTLLSFRSEAEIAALRAEVDAGRNPKDAKVALAREITTRFHSAAEADAAERDFQNRAQGGIPDDILKLTLSLEEGAPVGIGKLLKLAGLTASSGEGNRLIDGGGVRVDAQTVSDKGLKLGAGTYVVQVGKRKFVRVTLA
jgi:tyrosyl-tRNA synthetase